MRRGKIQERIDPKFIAYGGHQEIRAEKKGSFGELVLQEPDYGAAERAVPMSSPDDAKYIRITDYGEDGIEDNHEFVTAEFVDEKYLMEDEDILFARSGATAGKTFIYSKDLGKAIFAGYCIRFRFDKEKILPKYVYFYTKTSRYAAWVNSMQRAAGQPNINKEEYKSFVIPLPPLDIQSALVADMEAARLARQAKLSQADQLFKSINGFVLEQLGLDTIPTETKKIFGVDLSKIKTGKRLDPYFHQEKFSQLAALMESAPKLGEFIQEIHYGASVKNEYSEDGIPFLRILNIFPGVIDVSKIVYLPEYMRKELGKAFVKEGDFLISRSGSIGIVAKIPKECDGFAFGSFMIRFTTANVNKDYIEIWLNSSYAQAYLEQNRIGAIQGNITIETIENIPVFMPDNKTLTSIVDEYNRRRAQASQLRTEAEREWQEAKEKFEKALLG